LRQTIQRAGRTAGALGAACAAVTAAAAHADTNAATTPKLRVADRVVAGARVLATGVAPGAAQRTIALEHRTGAGAWTRLATTTADAGGGLRLPTRGAGSRG